MSEKPDVTQDLPPEFQWEVVGEVEGWSLFEDGNCYTHLQRVDDADTFASDLHATMHVVTKAMADEEGPHMQALEEWHRRDPEQYMGTLKALIGMLPGFRS